MQAIRKLGPLISSCLLAWGCGGPGDTAEEVEAAPGVFAAQAEPVGSPSSGEIEQMAYDFMHAEVPPERRVDPLAHLRRLSPEDFKRFRVAVADLNQLDGLVREIYDAYTDVLYERGVFMLDAGPELQEEAVRRAFVKHSDEWGPEVVERAVQRVVRERTPAFRRPAL